LRHLSGGSTVPARRASPRRPSASAEETGAPDVEQVTPYLTEVQHPLQLRGAAVMVGRADGTTLYRPRATPLRGAFKRHPELIYYPHPQWSKPVFAHTNPVYVLYRDQKIAKPGSARYLLERMDRLESWALHDAYFDEDARKEEALRTIRSGKELYRRIAGAP